MSLQIIQVNLLGDNYSYVLRDDQQNLTGVVDPGEAEPVSGLLDQKGWKLDFVLNTHHHFDHVGGNMELKQRFGCKIVGPEKERAQIPGIDLGLRDSDQFRLGDHLVDIIGTPGHTEGHLCYYYAAGQVLFSGDHLFSLGCGRLFGGTAQQMWASLQKIRKLPEETSVYCAHEYTESNARFAATMEPDNPALQKRIKEVARLRAESKSTVPSTIHMEISANPFLRPDSLEIRRRIKKQSASDQDVFTTLRQLKDRF